MTSSNITYAHLRSTKPSTSEPPASEDRSTVKIDLKAKSRKGKQIADIMNALTVDGGGDGDEEEEEDDLLALMDKAK